MDQTLLGRRWLLAGIVLLAAPSLGSQETTFAIGVHAIGFVTHETNTPLARTLTEGYLTQPVISGFFGRDWFHSLGTVDLEGLTLPRGELDQGAWGEGYVDRRHPHIYVHELIAGGEASAGFVRLSLFGDGASGPSVGAIR